MAQNIQVPNADVVVWEPSDVSVSLANIRKYVEEQADTACRWYMQRKRMKAWFSQYMRVGAIVSTSLAALFPTAAQLIPSMPSATKSGLIPAMLVGLAAALLGADKAFGFSTGWIRYISTATSIRSALEQFRMEWALKSSQAATPPTKPEIADLIQSATAFRLAVEGYISKETHEWAVEFQSTLAQLEKDVADKFDRLSTQALQEVKDARDKLEQDRIRDGQDAKARQEAERPGSLELALPNGLSADDRVLQVRMEGDGVAVTDSVTGSRRWARIGLKPGHYRILVSGRKDGKPINDQTVCEIHPGQLLKVEIPIGA
jgi:hypothetical protein